MLRVMDSMNSFVPEIGGILLLCIINSLTHRPARALDLVCVVGREGAYK